MIDELLQKASMLEKELAKVQEQRDNLNEEARKWSERRNEIRQQIASITKEAKDAKNIRDALNLRVRELKKQREQKQSEISEKRTAYLDLQHKVHGLASAQPLTEHIARKKFHELEWIVQTNRLSPEDEQEIIEQVRRLEKQLAIYNAIKEKENGLQDAKLDLASSRLTMNNYHQELSRLAEDSQENHERMRAFLQKVSELRAEADKTHQTLVETRKKADEAHQNFVELLIEKKMIDQQIKQRGQSLHLEQVKRGIDMQEEMTRVAVGKMQRGEKLTFDEFKLLLERGRL